MTIRLYYDDSLLTVFDATVEACVPAAHGYDVSLDRTAFYPASGGQPCDTGTLGGIDVVDVVDRGDAIGHIVSAPLVPGARVSGVIDEARRRDHREQHSGQHVLSAAFAEVCDVATVGFHMGAGESTIDLAREVTQGEIERAESLANRVVRENRRVTVRSVPAVDVPSLNLRRESAREGPLRIVEVEAFDVSACGGTHVVRTGEIGLVAVVGSEKVRGGTRLSFLCGGRVLERVRAYRDVLTAAGHALGTAPMDIAGRVGRLLEAAREADRTIKAQRDELAELRAASWRGQRETIGFWSAVIREAGCEGSELKVMAQAVAAGPGVVAVLTGVGVPVPVVVARSADVAFDAGRFIQQLTRVMGGRGGGRGECAQAGVNAPADEIVECVRRLLSETLPSGSGGGLQP